MRCAKHRGSDAAAQGSGAAGRRPRPHPWLCAGEARAGFPDGEVQMNSQSAAGDVGFRAQRCTLGPQQKHLQTRQAAPVSASRVLRRRGEAGAGRAAASVRGERARQRSRQGELRAKSAETARSTGATSGKDTGLSEEASGGAAHLYKRFPASSVGLSWVSRAAWGEESRPGPTSPQAQPRASLGEPRAPQLPESHRLPEHTHSRSRCAGPDPRSLPHPWIEGSGKAHRVPLRAEENRVSPPTPAAW